jgi:hypothetical protein
MCATAVLLAVVSLGAMTAAAQEQVQCNDTRGTGNHLKSASNAKAGSPADLEAEP